MYDIADVHRELPINKETGKTVTLDDICYIEDDRKISTNWIISLDGKKYQLKKQSNARTRDTVFVRKTMDGSVSIFYRGLPIRYEVID
ncbi:hypothetical protein FACS1894152_8290 [Bacilli bacterium]|nr:hypothetical protein FACS1894152_8290 [Bacilli bacterium]